MPGAATLGTVLLAQGSRREERSVAAVLGIKGQVAAVAAGMLVLQPGTVPWVLVASSSASCCKAAEPVSSSRWRCCPTSSLQR